MKPRQPVGQIKEHVGESKNCPRAPWSGRRHAGGSGFDAILPRTLRASWRSRSGSSRCDH